MVVMCLRRNRVVCRSLAGSLRRSKRVLHVRGMSSSNQVVFDYIAAGPVGPTGVQQVSNSIFRPLIAIVQAVQPPPHIFTYYASFPTFPFPTFFFLVINREVVGQVGHVVSRCCFFRLDVVGRRLDMSDRFRLFITMFLIEVGSPCSTELDHRQ